MNRTHPRWKRRAGYYLLKQLRKHIDKSFLVEHQTWPVTSKHQGTRVHLWAIFIARLFLGLSKVWGIFCSEGQCRMYILWPDLEHKATRLNACTLWDTSGWGRLGLRAGFPRLLVLGGQLGRVQGAQLTVILGRQGKWPRAGLSPSELHKLHLWIQGRHCWGGGKLLQRKPAPCPH